MEAVGALSSGVLTTSSTNMHSYSIPGNQIHLQTKVDKFASWILRSTKLTPWLDSSVPRGMLRLICFMRDSKLPPKFFAALKEKRQIQSSEAPGTSFFPILIGMFISKALCHCNLAILTFGESHHLEGEFPGVSAACGSTKRHCGSGDRQERDAANTMVPVVLRSQAQCWAWLLCCSMSHPRLGQISCWHMASISRRQQRDSILC